MGRSVRDAEYVIGVGKTKPLLHTAFQTEPLPEIWKDHEYAGKNHIRVIEHLESNCYLDWQNRKKMQERVAEGTKDKSDGIILRVIVFQFILHFQSLSSSLSVLQRRLKLIQEDYPSSHPQTCLTCIDCFEKEDFSKVSKRFESIVGFILTIHSFFIFFELLFRK